MAARYRRAHARPRGACRPGRPASSGSAAGLGRRRRRVPARPAPAARPVGRCCGDGAHGGSGTARRAQRARGRTAGRGGRRPGGRATSGTTGAPEGRGAHPRRGRRRPRATSARLGVDPAPTAGSPACRWPTSAACRWWHARWSPAPRSPSCPASTRRSARGRSGGVHARVTRAHRARPHRPVAFRAIVLGGSARPTSLPANVVHLRHDRDGQRRGVRRRAARRRRGRCGRRWRQPHAARADAAAVLPDGHRPKDAEGWLPTGDVGEFDDDGGSTSSAAAAT